MARDNEFSPEVHVLANTLRPRCVDQNLVVRRLRGVAQTSSTQFGHRMDHHTQTAKLFVLWMSEITSTQRYENGTSDDWNSRLSVLFANMYH